MHTFLSNTKQKSTDHQNRYKNINEELSPESQCFCFEIKCFTGMSYFVFFFAPFISYHFIQIKSQQKQSKARQLFLTILYFFCSTKTSPNIFLEHILSQLPMSYFHFSNSCTKVKTFFSFSPRISFRFSLIVQGIHNS